MSGKIMTQGLHTSFQKIFHQDTPVKVKPCYTPSHDMYQSVTLAGKVKINKACVYPNSW